jgi:hypothetical protein
MIKRPKCANYDKCGNEAITLINRMFLCGECFMKLKEKMEKLQEKLVFEE